MAAKLTKAMEAALVRIADGKWVGATPGTWRALKDRGLIEYKADGTLLSKLTPAGESAVKGIRSSS